MGKEIPRGASSGRKNAKDRQDISPDQVIYAREYWTGDSRDGALVNGDGYHYFRMTKQGLILEAFEFYETDDGVEAVAPLPEMIQVNWKEDLGFDDFEALDTVTEDEFSRVKSLSNSARA